jgi:hypothetical protein
LEKFDFWSIFSYFKSGGEMLVLLSLKMIKLFEISKLPLEVCIGGKIGSKIDILHLFYDLRHPEPSNLKFRKMSIFKLIPLNCQKRDFEGSIQ